MRIVSFACAVLAGLLLVTTARAHDPLTASVELQPTGDGLQFTITFARSVAAYLAGVGPAPRQYFDPADFPRHRREFEELVGTLCALRSGDDALGPTRTSVTLTSEEDVACVLTYAHPTAGAHLRLEGLWFAKLPEAEGYVAVFLVRGSGVTPATPQMLSGEMPTCDFTIEPSTPATGGPASAPSAGSAPADSTPIESRRLATEPASSR